ncbi:MAG: hypothetical protein ACI9XO_004057 [Paraglaciecola sp.]
MEIYNADNHSNQLYSVQSHQHVLERFDYEDKFVLKDSIATISSNNPNWILEVSMWGHETNPDTVSSIIQFK